MEKAGPYPLLRGALVGHPFTVLFTHSNFIMSKPISRQVQGILDYSAAPLVVAAPATLGFGYDKAPTVLSYVLGSNVVAVMACTRAEWGLVKAMLFKTHHTFDVLTALSSLGAPWLLGFARNKTARNTFLAIGATLLATGLLSERKEMPKYRELGE